MDDAQLGLAVADVYAAALFQLATAAGTVDDVRAELADLVRLEEENPDFGKFMTSTAVDDDARAASLEKMFRGRLSDIVLNTLQVMNQHERAGLLPQLLRAFVVRIEDARGQIKVTATSAVELNKALKKQVHELAEKLSGKQPLVEFGVDRELIGGLILHIGDYRFDDSVRRHLQVIRAQLLERSQRGLQVGVRE
ncbi:MAG: ATP synthase F1 subunit delta [Planctomycetota bacterium]